MLRPRPVPSPAVMGLCENKYGFYYFYLAVSLLFAVAILLVRKKEFVRTIPVEEQSDFVFMQDTSAVAVHMDPRLEPDDE